MSNDQCMYVRKLLRKSQLKILEGMLSVVNTGAGIVPVTNNQEGKPHNLGHWIELLEEFCFSSGKKKINPRQVPPNCI